jgi:hypothetical protein
MMRILGIVLLVVSSSLLLSACYEKVGVSLHEPGEYKGQKDPLLTKMKDPQLQKDLEERFKVSQSDR